MAKITYTPSKTNFDPCPEYVGQAKIVDLTETKEYTSQYGEREAFRYILEINNTKADGKYWTVATKPMTESLHEKANLRKFIEKVNGRPLTLEELSEGVDTEEMIGKYCFVVVEHNTPENSDTVFANITNVSKTKSNETWESDYVRLGERPTTVAVAKAVVAAAKKPMVSINARIKKENTEMEEVLAQVIKGNKK